MVIQGNYSVPLTASLQSIPNAAYDMMGSTMVFSGVTYYANVSGEVNLLHRAIPESHPVLECGIWCLQVGSYLIYPPQFLHSLIQF